MHFLTCRITDRRLKHVQHRSNFARKETMDIMLQDSLMPRRSMPKATVHETIAHVAEIMQRVRRLNIRHCRIPSKVLLDAAEET